jgi:ADP-glucose pyrophosphorylase
MSSDAPSSPEEADVSVAARLVPIEQGAEVEDCVIMDHARIGRGSNLRRVICIGASDAHRQRSTR